MFVDPEFLSDVCLSDLQFVCLPCWSIYLLYIRTFIYSNVIRSCFGCREVDQDILSARLNPAERTTRKKRASDRLVVLNLRLDMELKLLLLLLLCSSDLQAEDKYLYKESEELRSVGGLSPCAGTLEIRHGDEWIPVSLVDWSLPVAAVACQQLDCGHVISARKKVSTTGAVVLSIHQCSLFNQTKCVTKVGSFATMEIICSDSVRLMNGNSLCSGRLEVMSNQKWSSVCEADFDQQDAEVVCKELGCGAPSVFQGALYGEAEAPMWTKEFQCGGNESTLLDCESSDSARTTCSPGKAVGLTCSEPVRLVGGDSHCSGAMEVNHQGLWKPVAYWNSFFTPKSAAVVCKLLDCGYALSIERTEELSNRTLWSMYDMCIKPGSDLRDCVLKETSDVEIMKITCSDSVRLMNGNSLCSGRLEVMSNQKWSSVCEADFDQQDAEVVCRELGCGAPSVFQGALYGEVEAPIWTKEFQCGGNESTLLDCESSDSARTTCSPGKAVGLTCSEPLRLVGGASPCAGTLEVKHQGKWKPVEDWSTEAADTVCRELNCGASLSTGKTEGKSGSIWSIRAPCVEDGFSVKECIRPGYGPSHLHVTCSGQ